MNQSVMQRRQRLSAIKEIKEMMSRLDAEQDGKASTQCLQASATDPRARYLKPLALLLQPIAPIRALAT